MKRIFKRIVLIVFSIILLSFGFLTHYILFGGYVSESDIECVNHNEIYDLQFKNEIYKYENESREIFIYNSQNDTIVQTIIYKKPVSGQIKYKLRYSITSEPITFHDYWSEVDKNLRYIFVDYEDDIEDIDCQGFEPVGTKIYYTIADGERKSCWIYIIDESVT